MNRSSKILGALYLTGCVVAALPVWGAAHGWGFNEVFSNADGSIQFIEMRECCGFPNEIDLQDKWILSHSTQNMYIFPENLPPDSSANQYMLFATEGFARLPGAPTPDHIICDNFFSLEEDQLNFFFYISVFIFDSGQLPTDGIHSLQADGSVTVNSPTNFKSQQGSVDASGVPADFIRGDSNGDGTVDIGDPIYNLGYLFNSGQALCLDAHDTNDDGAVDIADPILNLSYLFSEGPSPTPPFPDCGMDAEPDLWET